MFIILKNKKLNVHFMIIFYQSTRSHKRKKKKTERQMLLMLYDYIIKQC